MEAWMNRCRSIRSWWADPQTPSAINLIRSAMCSRVGTLSGVGAGRAGLGLPCFKILSSQTNRKRLLFTRGSAPDTI